jgi:hypothetical protein
MLTWVAKIAKIVLGKASLSPTYLRLGYLTPVPTTSQSFSPLFISNKAFLILTLYRLLVGRCAFSFHLLALYRHSFACIPRLLVLASTLRLSFSLFLLRLPPAILSIVMDTSQAKPTTEQVKGWDHVTLLNWIGNNRPGMLGDADLKKFEDERIAGDDFLGNAGNTRFFKDICNLPGGPSYRLAKLASEFAEAGRESAGIKSKLLSFMSCTPRRQQANNVTGKRQQAEDVDMLSDTSSQPKQIADEGICQRTHTVIRLAEILEEQRVVLVRGTPSSGKTILSRLLRDYFENCGDNVVFIRGWRTKGMTATNYLTSRCSRAGYPGIQIDHYGDANIIFIIDEAQQSYSDISLWDFIKEKIGRHKGPKFCLFSSYGSPSQGMVITAETESYTPPFLGPKKRVSLTRSIVKDSPDICLFYSDLEFEDVVERFCTNPATRLKMDKAAQTYLLAITNGHPGAVTSMLDYIFKVCISRNFQVDERLMAIDIWI